jgi:preprotein translocase subunit YajC
MFISPAYAQGAGGGAGTFEALLPLILIFAVFYFLLIRPQQKKMKHHKEMLGSMRRGDRVVTGGGIMGTITKVLNDNELTVEIADGVKVRVQRSLISAVIAKTEPGGQPAQAPAAPAGGEGLGGIFKGFLGGGRK